MTAGRRYILISALSLATAGVLPAAASAQVVTVENAKFGAAGVVNANGVAVHSGPGENYYPTGRLDKGAAVTVVGVKFDWLKILPPDGSFSYVAKQFVEKTGGTAGRVNGQNVNVRVGSSLTPMKATIQCQLQANDPVEILGEAEEYYKIKPPAGAYLYVNKQYVDATKMLGPTDQIVKAAPSAGPAVEVKAPTEGATPPVATAGSDVAPQGTDTQVVPADATAPRTTAADPNAATAEKLTQVAVTTQPNAEITAALDAFAQAEKDFTAASQQPIDQQPVDKLTQAYTALAGNDKLPASVRRNAQIRLETLKFRADAQKDVLAVRKAQEAAKERTAALEAQQKALEAKLSGNRVLMYTAMGQLTTSSLKLGDTPVYRLVDPANGRTLVYIRGTETTLAGMLDQFVGVKGDLVNDPTLSLSIITPTAVEQLDPATTAATAAQIQPSSLKATASTNDK